MILHNKTTGEHGDYLIESSGDLLKVRNYYDDDEVYQYDSVAKFYEQWEDYEPAEPTIHEAKPSKWFGTLTEEERTRIARKADELQAKNLGSQS